MILFEHSDGLVDGVVMRDIPPQAIEERIANCAESIAAEQIIKRLKNIGSGQTFYGWKKECNVIASSLNEAIYAAQEADNRDKTMFVYRNNQWFKGISNSKTSTFENAKLLVSIATECKERN